MRSLLLASGMLAATPAFASPVRASGTFCDASSCETITATFQSDGTGILTDGGMSFPLRWRRNGSNFDMIVDSSVFRGTLSAGCVSGDNYFTLGSPGAPVAYDWFLCVDAP